MTVPINNPLKSQINFGITTPSEIDEQTGKTYIRYNQLDAVNKEWIYLIDESGATIQFKRAYDVWANRTTATYALLQRGE